MQPRKLNIFFGFPVYGGNGGIAMSHPSIGDWFARTMMTMKSDPRVGEIHSEALGDTPITMVRNRFIQHARAKGCDVLVMVDSDQHPDLLLGQDKLAKPFWDSSFDFLYQNYDKGPHVIGAPYCGPPPDEIPYIFRFANNESDCPGDGFKIVMYTREEAAIRSGIEPCAALPTGLIMMDMRAFDLIRPPYFRYEWTDEYEQDKASTEDVACTRDIGLCGQEKLGYSPIHVNWDAWAGHYKPKCVGKPKPITVSEINESYKAAVRRNHAADEQVVFVRPSPAMERFLASRRNGSPLEASRGE